jgi:hypothetical protein
MKILHNLLIAYVCFSVLIVSGGCNRSANKDRGNEKEEAQPSKNPVELSWSDGQAVLTLEGGAQKRLGLATTALAASAKRSELTAPALILSVQDLVSSRNGYVAAQVQLAKSRADADVARKEYSRLRTLFGQNQNTSEKSVQAAEAVSKARDADLTAAEQGVALDEATVRQAWGEVITKWIVEDSTQLHQVFNQRRMLVLVTLISAEKVELPRTISLELPARARAEATFVSPVPRVDPRIQGKSYLYVGPSEPGLAPGTNLVAHLAVGTRMAGVVVPSAAIVWSEGKAWVYQQTGQDQFMQRPIATNLPVENGYFVANGLQGGDKVVTQGAQALLSAQALAQSGASVADED